MTMDSRHGVKILADTARRLCGAITRKKKVKELVWLLASDLLMRPLGSYILLRMTLRVKNRDVESTKTGSRVLVKSPLQQ